MSTDYFDDLPFPSTIALDAFMGRREWSTSDTENQGGFVQRIPLWLKTRRSYEAGMATRFMSLWQPIFDHFDLCEGKAIGFPLLDVTDSVVTPDKGLLSLVTGKTYSMQKMRIVTNGVVTRTIFQAIGKPIVSTLSVYRTRSSVTTLVDPANYTATGANDKVVFAGGYTILGGDTFTFACQYYIPCRYATDVLEWQIVGRSGKELLIKSGTIPIAEDPQLDVVYLPPISS